MDIKEIRSFKNEYAFLSNFYKSTVEYNGIEFATVEAAFQAAKSLDKDTQVQCSLLLNPVAAKRFGRRVELRPDWEDVKVGIMEQLLRRKFTIPELRQKLLDTGDLLLVEGNTHGDKFWGQVNGVGKNQLGILLMKIREELSGQK